MKVIFLDVDGVLNFAKSEARSPSGYIGIAEACVKRLRKIVDQTNAKVVLTSTWKKEWSMNLEECTPEGVYLTKKLVRHGIHILSKTTDGIVNRGEGIHNWLLQHDNVTNWIVLDDDIFSDYEQFQIYPHLVLTEFSTGLQDEHVTQAIQLLNKGE